ncbi:MAG: radical SAM family heme chaperone HemW [Planctomycetaceae bacterium]
MKWPTPRSAYLHVPFCRHRCGYCNFSVIAGRDDLAEDYLRAIESELSTLGSARQVDTLFIGGGTPTHLSISQLERLFDSVDRWLPRAASAETTVEANPEDIDAAKLELLARRGVNRISLGVQSFSPAKLQILQRSHTLQSASMAIEQSAQMIGNVSIDLIFGAPQETPEHWRNDLVTALRLPIQHLSTYALTFEKGTSFWTERRRGNLGSECEDDELEMYQDAIRYTAAAGLTHYEISSFARESFRCRHNMAYWYGRGWFAFGPGAASFVDGHRTVNHRSTTTYLQKILVRGQSPIAEREAITPQQYACELAAFGVRLIDGVDLAAIHEESGIDVARLRHQEIERCEQLGLIEIQAGRIRLTAQGILMADSVATALLG